MNSTHSTSSQPAAGPLPSPIANPKGLPLGRVAIMALILVILAALAGLIPRWRQGSALRIETRELAIPTVIVVSATPGKAGAGLILPAEVRPLVEAPIYARASGYLKRWLVDIGTKVSAGQLLAEIDTPELNQELERARAELAQSQANLALAKTTAARWAELVKTSSVSEQEAAEKQADLALKVAVVEASQANLKRLEELQSFAKVTAPFDGTITVRRTDVGELITAGSAKQLFWLAQTATLRVYVRVPQSAVNSITVGQLAALTIPEMPGKVFQAKVVRTSGALSADSRTLLVELELDNPKGEVLAGTYVQVQFTDAHADVPLTLPSNVLLFRAEGTQVGVVKADGKVELRNVLLGRDFGQTIEVLSGVSPSDKVILNPADSLISGTVVRLADGGKAGGKSITP